ncbi:MAG: hypothetical protein PHR68_02740 [Candidatus Gracilibacteria bacterium]|nr:hypothetical protein [Candidatus Gracilibacteria bacterium]
MKREIFSVEMTLAEIFNLFYRFSKIAIKMIDSKNVILFEIKDFQQKNEIAKKLMESAVRQNPKANGKRILSNKRKSLFLKASIVKNSFRDMWRFEICQPNARGIIIDKYTSFFSFSDINSEMLLLFSLMTNQYLAEMQNQELKNELGNLKLSQKAFEDSIMFLDQDSIRILSRRVYITTFEKKQLKYTYEKQLNSYDEHSSKIDDGKQRQEVEERNAIIKRNLKDLKIRFPNFFSKFKSPE